MSTPAATGVSLTFRPNLDLLTAHLGRLATDHTWEPAVLTEIGEYMVGEVQDNFDEQRLWDGTPMPQSKAAIKRKGKTLIAKRHLYDSYVYQLEDGGVVIGSNRVYARIHHFGGETGAPGHRFEMEPRPVLGVGEVQDAHITKLLLDELRGLEPGGTA